MYYGFYGDPFIGELFNPENALEPCELCRYARILMYPLVFFSVVALIKKQTKIVDYFIPFCVLGLGLEIYHYTLQKFDIGTSFWCTRANPCAALGVDYFGFVTIPFLCLTAFVVITTVVILIKRAHYKLSKK